MTTGGGLFWVGVFYFMAQLVAYGYTFFTTRFPNKQVQRLDRLEKILRDSGLEEV